MPDGPTTHLDLRSLLDAAEEGTPSSVMDVVAAALGDAVGADWVALLIADHRGQELVRLTGGDAARPRRSQLVSVPISGTTAGRALRTQAVEVEQLADGVAAYAPVTSRGEAIGVLEAHFGTRPVDDALGEVATAAHALAYLVIANRRYTDLFEWGQRSRPADLEAEIQRRLLPDAFTCESGTFTLACWLEPTSSIGGDTFDFSVEGDALYLSLTDAMGHGVDSALLATVVVSSFRGARRRDLGLLGQAEAAEAHLGRHGHSGQFVTGLLGRVGLPDGHVSLVNAGHPQPLLHRDGRVAPVPLEADLPFGMGELGGGFRLQHLDLRPGDRLVLLTDGLVEHNARSLDVAELVAGTRALHPREASKDLTTAVLEASAHELRDDATVMILDWYGGEGRRRSSAGASSGRASA